MYIGADPELFLKDKNGKFISAIGKFGGTKEKPLPLAHLGDGFAVQEDNVAVEFNIPAVPLQSHQFVDVIQRAMVEIERQAAALNLEIAVVSSAEFEPDQLAHPRARRFGCDPDFNVWSLQINPPPRSTNKALRSCGGHIHVGGSIIDKIGLGRAMDLFVGCPSILFDPDTKRRLLYGKAGAIRDKPYGLEYRTISNFWVKSEKLIDMVRYQTQCAVSFVRNRNDIPDEDGRKIIHCINNSDQDLLKELTKKYKLQY
jgi:hypothetical protein